MKTIALINGKTLDPLTSKQHILNIVIGNEKIIGLGYIPDDEDSHILDISQCLIIPGITLSPLSSIPNLDTTTIKKKELLTQFFEKKHTLITTDTTGSELMYAIQLTSQHACKLHILMQKPETDLLITQQAKTSHSHLSSSIPYTQLIKTPDLKNYLGEYLKEKTIDCLSASAQDTAACLDFCFNDLLTFITLNEVIALICKNPSDIFETKISGLGLLSKPSFYVIKPKSTPCIQCEVQDGKVIQPELNP